MLRDLIVNAMTSKSMLIAALLSVSLSATTTLAAEDDQSPGKARPDIVDPDLERRGVDLANINTEDFEIGAYYGVISIEDFGSNDVFGARFAFHVTEGLFFEAMYGTSDAGQTSFEVLGPRLDDDSGPLQQLFTDEQREFSYYNLSMGWNLFPGEAFIGKNLAFNSDLYVILGVGNTRFGEEDHFTVNFGMGYRLLLTDWLAFHADVRDHIFDSQFIGPGNADPNGEKTVHNIEIHAGFTVFF